MKKLKVIRTEVYDDIKDKTYYKVEAEVDPDNNTITFETSRYSWGHSDWEGMNEVSTPYGTSSTFSNCCYLACFKTQQKDRIPDNVEALLLEQISKNVEEEISYLDAKSKRIANERDEHQAMFEQVANHPLILGKKLGIT